MTFDWQTDPDEARAEVDAAMNSIMNLLPSDLQDSYRVGFFAGENAGYLIIGITSTSTSPEELYRILNTTVEPMMNGVEDAESVDIYRVEDLEVEVTLHQADMLAYGLDIQDVESEGGTELEPGQDEYSIEELPILAETLLLLRAKPIEALQDLQFLDFGQHGPIASYGVVIGKGDDVQGALLGLA